MEGFESIAALRRGLEERRLSAVELTRSYLDRIERTDAGLGSFREVWADHALARAMEIDEQLSAGENPGPLAGIPLALKDNIVTKNGRTTCGSRMLEEYTSPFSATVVMRLSEAGAIILGKTNCDEFAMGSSTEHSAFGPTRNPWDEQRVPGGSSGGSAAAVAAGLCPAALGSDTGGSIRQPAAFCGVVGLKPTYGRVSRYGLVAYASSLDQIGPLTRTVSDTALLLDATSGYDPRDSTSARFSPTNLVSELEHPLPQLRVGVPRALVEDESNHPAVRATIDRAIEAFRGMGATICDIDLSLTDHAIATYYVIATAEASSNLARFDGIRYGRRARLEPGEDLHDLYDRSRAEGFGPEVQRRIMLGTFVLSAGYYDAYYRRAQQARRLIRNQYDRAFESCQVILGPTTPSPAFRLGEKEDPLSMYLCDRYTVGANIAGICALSLPYGLVEVDGTSLPLGVQLQAQAFDESTLLRTARMLELTSEMASHHPTACRSK